MKLYDRLPDSVTVNGKRYRLDLDFRNVLKINTILSRKDLLPASKEYLALKCVMKRPPADTKAVWAAVHDLLFPERRQEEEHKKITDFDQDAEYIRAAFLQTYGINLWRDKLHWFEFTGLLSGLPEGSRYAEILGIRSRPIPEATKWNQAEREWLLNAKAVYALDLTPEEAADMYERGVKALASGLMAWAQREGVNNG